MNVLCYSLSEITMNLQVQDEWREKCGGYHLYFQRMISEICSRYFWVAYLIHLFVLCNVWFTSVICLSFNIQVLSLNNGIVLFEEGTSWLGKGLHCNEDIRAEHTSEDALHLPQSSSYAPIHCLTWARRDDVRRTFFSHSSLLLALLSDMNSES